VSEQRIGGKFALDAMEAANPMAVDYLLKVVRRDVDQKVREADRVVVGEVDEQWTAERWQGDEKVERPWKPGESLAGVVRVYLAIEAITVPEEEG